MTQSDMKRNQLPPMLNGLPILGNTLEALHDVMGMLVQGYLEHGPVFRISRFGQEVYMLAGIEANEFYLANQDTFFYSADVYHNMTRETGTDHYFNALDGPLHRHLRRQIQPGFSRQQIADQIPQLIESTRQEARQWSRTEPIEAMSTLSEMLLRQASLSMLGHETDSVTAKSLDAFFKTFVGVGVGIQPHLFTRRPAYQRGKRTFEEAMNNIVAEHQAQPPKSGCPLDLVHIALASTYEPDGEETLNAIDARAATYYPYMMNAVYTNRSVSYLLYELLKNSDAMARVTAEVDAVLSGGELSLTTLQRMPVLRAAIKEILRLYPLVAAVPRHTKEAFEYGGYHIPKGQKVYTVAPAMHFMPEYFPDPYTFDLDRCLPPRNEHRQPRVYGPFGLGHHSCLGANLTEVFMQTTLIGILGSVTLKIMPKNYVAKRKANPLPGPEGMKLQVTGHREPKSPDNRQILTDADVTLLAAGLELSKEQQNELLTRATQKHYAAGATIIQQGDEADAFYLLLEGAVDIFLEQPGQDKRLINRLTKGAIFGEIGLLQAVPRTTTVKVGAAGTAQVLVIDRETFTNLVLDHDLTAAEIGAIVQQRMINSELARALPLLTREQIALVAPDALSAQYAPGDVIIQEGDIAESFYILTKGNVEVVNHFPNGEEIIINRQAAGEYFGEIGLLQNRPRTATVRASVAEAGNETVEVLAIGKQSFLELLDDSHATELSLAQEMARRLTNLAA